MQYRSSQQGDEDLKKLLNSFLQNYWSKWEGCTENHSISKVSRKSIGFQLLWFCCVNLHFHGNLLCQQQPSQTTALCCYFDFGHSEFLPSYGKVNGWLRKKRKKSCPLMEMLAGKWLEQSWKSNVETGGHFCKQAAGKPLLEMGWALNGKKKAIESSQNTSFSVLWIFQLLHTFPTFTSCYIFIWIVYARSNLGRSPGHIYLPSFVFIYFY